MKEHISKPTTRLAAPWKKVLPSERNRVIHLDTDPDLQSLADNIRDHGLAHPPLVRKHPTKEGFWEIVCGGRRHAAAGLLGWETIPVDVGEFTDAEATALRLSENDPLLRRPLTAMQEGQQFRETVERKEFTLEGLAKLLDKSRSYVTSRLALARVTPAVDAALAKANLPDSIALKIPTIPTEKAQLAAIKDIAPGQTHWNKHTGKNETRPFSARQVDDLLAEKHRCNLAKAGWKLDDAQLLPAAGSCQACPHRTGNCDPESASANVCTQPACFAEKHQAHRVTVTQKYTARGYPLLSAAAEKKTFQYGWVSSDEFCEAEEPISGKLTPPQVLDAAAKKGCKLPAGEQAVAAVNAQGQATLLYRRAALDQARAALGEKVEKRKNPETRSRREQPSATEQAQAAWEKHVQAAGQQQLIAELARQAADAKNLTAGLRALLINECEFGQLDNEVARRHGLKDAYECAPLLQALRAYTPAQLVSFLLESALTTKYYAERILPPIGEEFGLDAKRFLSQAAATLSALPEAGQRVAVPAEELQALHASLWKQESQTPKDGATARRMGSIVVGQLDPKFLKAFTKGAQRAAAPSPSLSDSIPNPAFWHGHWWVCRDAVLDLTREPDELFCLEVVPAKQWKKKTVAWKELPRDKQSLAVKNHAGLKLGDWVCTGEERTFVPETSKPEPKKNKKTK